MVSINRRVNVEWLPDEDQPDEDQPDEDQPDEDQPHTWSEIEPLLEYMDPELADILTMSHQQVTQRAIGKVLGHSQSTVSYRLWRAKCALQFLLVRETVCGRLSQQDFERDLANILTTKQMQTAWLVYHTTSHIETARLMGCKPSTIWDRCIVVEKKIRKAVGTRPELQRYIAAIELLHGHYNITRIMPWTRSGRPHSPRYARVRHYERSR